MLFRSCLGCAALLAGLALLPWTAAPRGLEVIGLDVGHGTSVVLRAPGEPAWVFDAGSRDRTRVGPSGLGPLLRSWDAGRVELVLSHADADHTNGWPWLFERWTRGRCYGAPPAHQDERLTHTARCDLAQGLLRLPTRGPLSLGLARACDEPGNEGSRTLLVSTGGQRLVFTGDADARRQVELPGLAGSETPCALALLPHHGAAGMYLGRWLDRLRPAEVWISCAGPAPAEAELERRGIPWRSTARDGPLTWSWFPPAKAPP